MRTNDHNFIVDITDAMATLGNHVPVSPAPSSTGTDIHNISEELRTMLEHSHNAMNQFIADTCKDIQPPQDVQHPKNIRELITLMEKLLEKQHDPAAKLATLEELRNLIESISDYLGVDAISFEVNEKPILLIKKNEIPSFNNSTQFDLNAMIQLMQHDRAHHTSYSQNTFTHPYTRNVVSIGATHEIRPLWNDDNKKLPDGIEKTTYERTQQVKIFIKKAVDAIYTICGRIESTPAHTLAAATSPLTTVSPINYSNFRTQLLNDFCISTIVHATYLIPELEKNRQILRDLVDFVKECPYATINADHDRYQQLQKKLASTISSIEDLLKARETLLVEKLVNNAKLLAAQDSKKVQYMKMTNTNLRRELEGVLKDLKNAQALFFPTATMAAALASPEATPHYSKKAEFKMTVAGKEYSSIVELNKDANAPVTACFQISENKNDQKFYPVLVLKQKAAKEAVKASADDKAKQSTDTKNMDVVLLIDHSGSMYEHSSFVRDSRRADAVQQFATGLVEALDKKNQSLSVSEIAFGSTAEVQYTAQSYIKDKENIIPGETLSQNLNGTCPEMMFSYSNSQDLKSPIETVADAISEYRSTDKNKRTVHIFIVTDGDFITPYGGLLHNNHLTDANYRYTRNNYGVILKATADVLRRENCDVETHYVMISGNAQKKVDGIYATTKHSIQKEEDIQSTVSALTTAVESHTQSISVTVAVTACGHAIVPLNTMTSGSLSLDSSIQTHDSTYHVNEKGFGVVLSPELRNFIDNRNDDLNTATSAHDQKIADLAVAETFKDFEYFYKIEFSHDGALDNNMREGQASHANQSSQRANTALPISYGSAAPILYGSAAQSFPPSGNNDAWKTTKFGSAAPMSMQGGTCLSPPRTQRSGAMHLHFSLPQGGTPPPTTTTNDGGFFQPQPRQQPQQPISCDNIYQAIENGLQLIQSNSALYQQLANLCINPSFDPTPTWWNNVKDNPRLDAAWLKWFLDCINRVLINYGRCPYQVAQQPAPQLTQPGW